MSVSTIITGFFDLMTMFGNRIAENMTLKTSYQIAQIIIKRADELKKIIDDENKVLLEKGGDAFFDHDVLTIVLICNGERVYHTFPELLIEICRTNLTGTITRLSLNGQFEEDGFIYYIHAHPTDFGSAEFAIQLSKKEATFLKAKIAEVEKIQYDLE